MLSDQQMYQAAELFRQDNISTLSEARYNLMLEAVYQALDIIHGPDVNEPREPLDDSDPMDLFDENWQLAAMRQYDRDDKMNWIVNASVIPGPDIRADFKNTVGSKAKSYRGAAFSTLILAALLFQSMSEPPEQQKEAA